MNKKELVSKVTEHTEMTKKDAGVIVDAVFESLTAGLVEDHEVKLTGFGKFTVKEQAARQARNPATGEIVEVPKRNVARFKAAKQLKEAVK